jgi:hypothetical protein
MIYCISITYNHTQDFPIASTNSALERLVDLNYQLYSFLCTAEDTDVAFFIKKKSEIF